MRTVALTGTNLGLFPASSHLRGYFFPHRASCEMGEHSTAVSIGPFLSFLFPRLLCYDSESGVLERAPCLALLSFQAELCEIYLDFIRIYIHPSQSYLLSGNDLRPLREELPFVLSALKRLVIGITTRSEIVVVFL